MLAARGREQSRQGRHVDRLVSVLVKARRARPDAVMRLAVAGQRDESRACTGTAQRTNTVVSGSPLARSRSSDPFISARLAASGSSKFRGEASNTERRRCHPSFLYRRRGGSAGRRCAEWDGRAGVVYP